MLREKEIQAFVDEDGDPNLETTKQGATTYYIIVAVILEADCATPCRTNLEEVRKKHFGPGPMKSKNVGNNEERRIEILTDLNIFEWKFCALAIDKREVDKNSGLIHKTSFRKYLNNRLYQRLFGTFPNITVTADKVGKPEFMDGFIKYVEANHPQTELFRRKFEFESSEGEILIQLADFIAGSLARIFDPTKLALGADAILNLIRPHSLGIEQWPFRQRIYAGESINVGGDSNDEIIREQGEMSALQFLERFSQESDPLIRLQVETLNQLLFHFYNVDAKGFIFGDKLVESVKEATGITELTLHTFRTQVIAKLRDEGVLLASSSNGYKIPSSYKDIQSFVDRGHTVIEPMLARLDKARKRIHLATHGQVDILSNPRFEYLKKFLDEPNY